jgi:hypothetical protein
MEESYGEGVASHTGPELCGASREAGLEALVGVRAGRPLSPEISSLGCRRCLLVRKATLCPARARAGQGPHGVADPAHARKHLAREPGDPRFLQAAPAMQERWSAAGSLRTHAADVRTWEVTQLRSTEEGLEQGQEAGGGETGGKAAGQAELAAGHYAPDIRAGRIGHRAERAWAA